jgi:predicted DNA-binding transcriptional regulator YafY
MEWLVGGVALLVAFLLYHYRDRHYSVPERMAIIRDAIMNGRDIWMVYFTFSRRRFSERTVTPLKVERGIYLLAIDHYWEKRRTFKISRIKELKEISRN